MASYKNEDEPCVYKKISGSIVVFLILYVDDILIIRNDIPTLQTVKVWLSNQFSMKDLGEVTYILGKRMLDFPRVHASYTRQNNSKETYIHQIMPWIVFKNLKIVQVTYFDS